MRSADPFLVHVADLLDRVGKRRTHPIATPVDWAVEMSRVDTETPIDAEIELVSGSGGLVVRGLVTLDLVHTCPRCLREWEETRSVEVAEVIETEDGEGDYEIVAGELDLEPVLRDAVLLELPLLPVCPEGCQGLVQRPESDLNTGSPEDRPESPFAALKDLFEPRD